MLPTVINSKDYTALYANMRTAIAQCHAVDECKDIADRSAAMATYFKQIKDDETVRKFHEIKLRSWRRIGELFLDVDFSRCHTQAAKAKAVRSSLGGDPVVAQMGDWQITNAIKLAELPPEGFEAAIAEVNGSIQAMLFRGDPAAVAKVEAAKRENGRKSQEYARAVQERYRVEQEARQEEDVITARLKEAHDVAMGEVGVTLKRKDRKDMKEIVFLVKSEIHEALRQAAFDQRVTMHEILRRGLGMWFAAHGYSVSMDDGDAFKARRRQREEA